MKREASEIIYLSLKQHFQKEPESRIMELTLKLQARERLHAGRRLGTKAFSFDPAQPARTSLQQAASR
jgi:hypothetical protein